MKKTIEELVKDFNKKHAFVLDGDKSRVFIDSRDTLLDREYYISVSVPTFRDMYEAGAVHCGEDMNGKIQIKTPANAWLSSENRRQFLGGVYFDPSGKQYPDKLNLWRGYSVKPKSGNWELIKAHIRGVIADNNEEVYQYIMGWLALTLQHPENQTEVALILRGNKGCGKGLLGHVIRKLFGNHGLHITSCHHLTGKFNSHLRDCAFLFVDEAIWAGDKQHESVLKGLVTEPVLTIEGKGANAYQSKNMLSILMASNEQWVVPASVDERRFCVLDVSSALIGVRKYYDPLVKQCNSKSAQAAMLYDLLNYDLTNFEVRNIPETDALKEQREHSMDSLGKWWLNLLSRGFIYKARHNSQEFRKWHQHASTMLLKDSYLQFCAEQRLGKYDIKDERELGKFLSNLYGKKQRTRKALLLGETIDGIPHFSCDTQNYFYDLGTIDSAQIKFCEIEKLNLNFDNGTD